jgi:hypothetical protein
MTDSRKQTAISNQLSRREFLGRSAVAALTASLGCGKGSRCASKAGPAQEGVSLQIDGNTKKGYGVTILYRGRPVARHNAGGEFSAVFQNGERSLEDRVENWKAASWSGDAMHVVLEGKCLLKSLNATLFAQVEYQVVRPKVVRKRICFRQADMYMLFYQVSNRLEPVAPPAKFWSFDQADCQGGALREYFPAAGFRTKSDLSVGLLTDAGYRNQWSRSIRRDGKPVKPAPRLIPDAHLYEVSGSHRTSKGQSFAKQTFGEALEWTDDEKFVEKIPLPEALSWERQGTATLEEREGAAILSVRNSEDGIMIPFSIKGGSVYSLRLEYRARQPIAVQMWDLGEQHHRIQEITLYNDALPESTSEWTKFQSTVFVPARMGQNGGLFISVPPSEQATQLEARKGAGEIILRGLEIRRLGSRNMPYHRLEMDRQAQKTSFIFADDTVPDTLRHYRIATQVHLADGLGFQGGEVEKILYADLMMLCWNVGPESFRPMVAPSIWYSAAGEMYLRDSFFALNGIHNRTLNEAVFNLWGENQGTDGAINTLVEPGMANVERKSNDSTPLWLIWALLNRSRFSTKLPMEKLSKAARYCLRTYDSAGNGTCWAQFVMGQLDVISYPQGTTGLCENQGMLAVLLRVIKELEIPEVSSTVSEEHVNKAEENYRGYYDPARKFLRPQRDIADAIGFAELFPEYLSLWLFNRKILTDEMVVNHLNRIPVLLPRQDSPFPEAGGTVRPILIGLSNDGGWRYFTERWHPMVSDSFARNYAQGGMNGVYYNGGSWMRLEVCGYVTGMLHGWEKAKKAISNRLWAEVNIAPDYPTSQEYLATDPDHRFFGYHRVFAWNSFVLQALEQAGLRTAAMDPDASKG